MSAQKTVQLALAGLMTLSVASAPSAQAQSGAPIKCYGIAGASQNDCATTLSACAGGVHQAKACYAWVYGVHGNPHATAADCTAAGGSPNQPAAHCEVPKA